MARHNAQSNAFRFQCWQQWTEAALEYERLEFYRYQEPSAFMRGGAEQERYERCLRALLVTLSSTARLALSSTLGA